MKEVRERTMCSEGPPQAGVGARCARVVRSAQGPASADDVPVSDWLNVGTVTWRIVVGHIIEVVFVGFVGNMDDFYLSKETYHTLPITSKSSKSRKVSVQKA